MTKRIQYATSDDVGGNDIDTKLKFTLKKSGSERIISHDIESLKYVHHRALTNGRADSIIKLKITYATQCVRLSP